METVRKHQVTLRGVVSTVVVTTLVLEGWCAARLFLMYLCRSPKVVCIIGLSTGPCLGVSSWPSVAVQPLQPAEQHNMTCSEKNPPIRFRRSSKLNTLPFVSAGPPSSTQTCRC